MTISNPNGGFMKTRETHLTVVPPTPGELAVASARWERRGLLGRLVRIDDSSANVEEEQLRPAA
jgi:hypothetical protein